MENWVDIKEAARILGLSGDTIRKRIKRGEMTGQKIPCHNGFKWQVKIDNGHNNSDKPKSTAVKADTETQINTPSDTEPRRDEASVETVTAENPGIPCAPPDENPGDRRIFSGQVVQVEGTFPGKSELLYEQIITEKDRRLEDQLHHTSILEQLLSDFQGRIHVLETDNRDMNQQIRQLPAPPIEIGKRLEIAENQITSMEEDLAKKESLTQTLARQLKQERENTRLTRQEVEEQHQATSLLKEELHRKDGEVDELQQKLDRLEVEQSYERQKTDDLKMEKKRLEKALSDIWKEKDHLSETLEKRNREMERIEQEIRILKQPWWKKVF